jgi:hypothetical protein
MTPDKEAPAPLTISELARPTLRLEHVMNDVFQEFTVIYPSAFIARQPGPVRRPGQE